ncbi:unnamed protein product [Polarella glacialis]|uniref:STI1 domain-containing protein n=1 Tax=Polarella glacialis TaxID=89957 RepID=A0A813HBL1_POLGL|nr:unnamed protein product [Polarella glacialis]CAE8652591.1 unnamed protein product [Polarella glacialis]|mmetsp:Transcript_33952/g.61087  ORF Transcript_33952/g.61087 Transcript_33952/m.61087 type:complete len:483 (+) Transcript_33952:128-1576(+)
MCAKARPVREAGPHATVEEIDAAEEEALCGGRGLRVVIDLPFELQSMAEAQLDVCARSVLLIGPAALGSPEVKVPLPQGYELDPDRAVAKFSRKRRQLTITSPNVAVAETLSEATPQQHQQQQPQQQQQPAKQPVQQTVQEPAKQLPKHPQPAASAGDDDDDDDLPPPLEATRSVAKRAPDEDPGRPSQSSTSGGSAGEELRETNEAAEAMMQKALAAREQKKQENEEARRSADLGSGGGLKKGFFSNAKASKKPAAVVPKFEPEPRKAEEIPYITGVGDAKAMKMQGLQMPEVQQALKQNMKKLESDQSWVTPQLMNALQSRPDLLKGLSDPKIQEAMQMMQKDPDAAKQMYSNDPDVTAFLKDFSALMATHFDVLSKEAPKDGAKDKPPAAASSALAKPAAGQVMSSAAASAAGAQMLALDDPLADPKVAEAFQDPEVQKLIAALRSGMPLEMHELAQGNPRLFMKVKILLDSGLLGLQR